MLSDTEGTCYRSGCLEDVMEGERSREVVTSHAKSNHNQSFEEACKIHFIIIMP